MQGQLELCAVAATAAAVVCLNKVRVLPARQIGTAGQSAVSIHGPGTFPSGLVLSACVSGSPHAAKRLQGLATMDC
jgi:hypothetical protein